MRRPSLCWFHKMLSTRDDYTQFGFSGSTISFTGNMLDFTTGNYDFPEVQFADKATMEQAYPSHPSHLPGSPRSVTLGASFWIRFNLSRRR